VRSERLDPTKVRHLVIAGWTGRDNTALEAHIHELEALGVKRPKSTPIFYRVAASLLTTAGTIEVLGPHSSGEAECVVYDVDGSMWVGVGSDHTDRKAETLGVSMSKQMCAKPVGAEIWPFEEVAPHWDKLVLRSFVRVNGERHLYQEGPVISMRPPQELIRLYTGRDKLPAGSAMFCGTLAVRGGVAPAGTFEMELNDPILGRSINHHYRIETLPDEG
jgi:hypothetical protein